MLPLFSLSKPRPPAQKHPHPPTPRPRPPSHHFQTPGHEPTAGPAPNATSAFHHVPPRPRRRAEGRGPARVAATEPHGPSPPLASPGRPRRPLRGAGTTGARPRLALGGPAGRAWPARRGAGRSSGAGGAGLWLGGAPASGAGRGQRAGLLPFPPAAPAAAALPGRRGGGAEEPRRLLLFECARPALSPSARSVSVCPASPRPLTPGG